jgi:hypothetical protein
LFGPRQANFSDLCIKAIKKSEEANNGLLTLKYKLWLDNKANLLAQEAAILAEAGANTEYEKALLLRKSIAILADRQAKQKNADDYLQTLTAYQTKTAFEKKEERYKPSGFVNFMSGNTSQVMQKIFGEKYGQKINTGFAYASQALSYVWGKLSIAGFFFWLTFMTFVIATSFGAAIASPILVPLIVGISIGLAGAFNIWEVVEKRLAKKSGVITPTATEQAAAAEAARKSHDHKLRLFMKVEREGLDENIKNRIAQLPKQKIAVAKEKIDIRTRLLGNKFARGARVFTTGLRGVIDAIMFFTFTGWFLSTVVGLVPALAGVAIFLGNNATGGITGLITGAFLGFKAGAKLRAEQLKYKEKVDALLAAPYLGNDGAGKTKQEAFENLYAVLEAKKAQLLQRLSAKELKGRFHYDLSKVNVFNDRTFEKLQHTTPTGTIVKKILSRVAAIFGGSQTGIFHARYFFLKGAVFAGALNMIAIGSLTLGAAFWPFIIIAGVFAAVFAILKVVEYQQQRNQAHNENLYNTFDARISFMKKRIKEIDAINSLLDKPASTTSITQRIKPVSNQNDLQFDKSLSDSGEFATQYSGSQSLGRRSAGFYRDTQSVGGDDRQTKITHSRTLTRSLAVSAST